MKKQSIKNYENENLPDRVEMDKNFDCVNFIISNH